MADSCKICINDAEGTSLDNGTINNYWSDYNGIDSNSDGIGGTQYPAILYKWDNNIHGDVSFVYGQDNYPLMNPVEIEVIQQFP